MREMPDRQVSRTAANARGALTKVGRRIDSFVSRSGVYFQLQLRARGDIAVVYTCGPSVFVQIVKRFRDPSLLFNVSRS